MQLAGAEEYIRERLKNDLPEQLCYHDYEHTSEVVDAAMYLAQSEGISDKEQLNILRTAALYHDCGFLHAYEHHEEESCNIAASTLPRYNFNADQINMICSLIMKTKVPQKPTTLLEEILCDADLAHLGNKLFDERSNKLFDEWFAIGKVKDRNEYNKLQIQFIQSHRYWTDSARLKLEPVKKEHLNRLQRSFNDSALK